MVAVFQAAAVHCPGVAVGVGVTVAVGVGFTVAVGVGVGVAVGVGVGFTVAVGVGVDVGVGVGVGTTPPPRSVFSLFCSVLLRSPLVSQNIAPARPLVLI